MWAKKNSPTSFSLQLKHLVTTLLKPKNEDFTFSSCLKHIFFITLLYLVYWCTTYVIWVYVVLSFLWENFFSVQIPWFFICWIVVIPHRVILQLFFAKAKLSLPSFSSHKLKKYRTSDWLVGHAVIEQWEVSPKALEPLCSTWTICTS